MRCKGVDASRTLPVVYAGEICLTVTSKTFRVESSRSGSKQSQHIIRDIGMIEKIHGRVSTPVSQQLEQRIRSHSVLVQ